MKTLVIYDSVHGNTEQIAQAIGGAIGGEVQVLRAVEVNPATLDGYDLLVIGAPTHGGGPTEPIQDLLKGVPANALQGSKAAAFDTRLAARWVRVFGYAAGKIAKSLETQGATLVVPAEGFTVRRTKGPLLDGELQRAAAWARGIVEGIK